MIAESIETMMLRNDTTLQATAQECPKMNATTSKASKNNRSSMLVSAFFVMLCLCFLINDSNAAVYKKRAIASDSDSTTVQTNECQQNTPCGWAIYEPSTRRITSLVENTCVCNPDLECSEYEDNLYLSSYVYRCQEITPAR